MIDALILNGTVIHTIFMMDLSTIDVINFRKFLLLLIVIHEI